MDRGRHRRLFSSIFPDCVCPPTVLYIEMIQKTLMLGEVTLDMTWKSIYWEWGMWAVVSDYLSQNTRLGYTMSKIPDLDSSTHFQKCNPQQTASFGWSISLSLCPIISQSWHAFLLLLHTKVFFVSGLSANQCKIERWWGEEQDSIWGQHRDARVFILQLYTRLVLQSRMTACIYCVYVAMMSVHLR